MKALKTILVKALRGVAYLAALLFGLQVFFAFFGLPGSFRMWMYGADLVDLEEPSMVVVLGGGGIPSPSGLMRTYRAAEFGRTRPWLRYIVSLPSDMNPHAASVGKMRDELVMRGVHPEAIELETVGRNTMEQAKLVRAMFGEDRLDEPILLVTSSYHMRRSILCFRKQGFTRVVGLPTYSQDIEADLGRGLHVRYGIWSAWETQAQYLRELVAIAYYSFRGWV